MSKTPNNGSTELINYTVTCHTEGCENADIPIVLSMPEGCAVMCGVCAQTISDTNREA